MANLGICKDSTLGSCHIVEEILGEGGFGVVAKCRNTLTNKTVAVKVHKKKLENALEEILILKWLQRHGSDACNIVRWDGYFFDKEKLCISFEHLDQSLHHYQMAQNAKCLSMVELKSVLHQLATALSHLHSIDIIHADLKPMNIMVVDRHQHPIKVKIIDFGLARLASEVQQGECRGTMCYNAPEMSLGVPFNEAIDMWALGVIMAELAMGCTLSPGMTEYDVLRAIVETQGQPPDDMLDCGMHTEDFFNTDDYGRSCWRFMTPHDVYQEYGLRATDARSTKLRSLDDIQWHMERHRDGKMLVSLIKSMLNLDPHQRITAREVLEHQLFAPSLPQSLSRHTELDVVHLPAASCEEDKDSNVQLPNRCVAAPSREEDVDFNVQPSNPHSAAPLWHEGVDFMIRLPTPNSAASWDEEGIDSDVQLPHPYMAATRSEEDEDFHLQLPNHYSGQLESNVQFPNSYWTTTWSEEGVDFMHIKDNIPCPSPSSAATSGESNNQTEDLTSEINHMKDQVLCPNSSAAAISVESCPKSNTETKTKTKKVSWWKRFKKRIVRVFCCCIH